MDQQTVTYLLIAALLATAFLIALAVIVPRMPRRGSGSLATAGAAAGAPMLVENDLNGGRAMSIANHTLPSKMRYLAAQFNALLEGDLWLLNARHSNEMAALLYDAVVGVEAIDITKPQVNGLFPIIPAAAVRMLQEWSFFWEWDPARSQVRWMTSWDTTARDVEQFAAGVAAATYVTRATSADN